jgi:glutaminyl-tRNA synthetase
MVRLRYGFVVKCIGCDKDADGNITAVHCEVMPDSKSGTPGADTYKVKGNIHWVSAAHALDAPVSGSTTACSPSPRPAPATPTTSRRSIRIRCAWLPRETGTALLRDAKPEDRFQFERHGYFVADAKDSKPGAPVFNRAVTLPGNNQLTPSNSTSNTSVALGGITPPAP